MSHKRGGNHGGAGAEEEERDTTSVPHPGMCGEMNCKCRQYQHSVDLTELLGEGNSVCVCSHLDGDHYAVHLEIDRGKRFLRTTNPQNWLSSHTTTGMEEAPATQQEPRSTTTPIPR
jgi:hypothetical protein